MLKRTLAACSARHGGGRPPPTYRQANSGNNSSNKRRQPSVPTLPNVRDLLRKGNAPPAASSPTATGRTADPNTNPRYSYSSLPMREVGNVPPPPHMKSASNHNSPSTSSSSAPPQPSVVESFSFRIGSRFAGIEPSSASSATPSQTYVAGKATSSSSDPTSTSQLSEFDASSANRKTFAHTKSGSDGLDVEAIVEEDVSFVNDDENASYLDYLGEEEKEGEVHPRRGGGGGIDRPHRRSRSFEEDEVAEGGEGGDYRSEAATTEESSQSHDPEQAARKALEAQEKRRERAIKVRTIGLVREIRRMAPAVRDWHALAASRKKTLVVEMDTEVEVRRDELQPYLAPESELFFNSAPRSDTVKGFGGEEEQTATKALSSADLWACTKLLRKSRMARESQRTVVTGGKATIRRIWREYKIVPNVVYVPDDEPIPSWCLDTAAANMTAAARRPIIVRAPGASINKDLLSADLNDGYAAEFTLDERSPIFRHGTATFSGTTRADVAEQREATEEAAKCNSSTAGLDPALLYQDPKHTKINLRSSVFLSEARIPSNVGLVIKSAVENGMDAIILDRCVDMLSEKVIRASEGTLLHPKVKIFQLNEAHGVKGSDESTDIIQKACLRHNLLPLVTVPSQTAVPAFQMAQELFYEAEKYDEKARYKAAASSAGSSSSDHHTNNHSSNSNISSSSASGHSSDEKEGTGASPSSQTTQDDRSEEAKLNTLALIRNPRDESYPPPQGAMLMLGSESLGLHHIVHSWPQGTYSEAVPYRAVTLSMPDFRVDSINVAVAGGIIMRMFRPRAREEHKQLFRLGVVPEGVEELAMLPKKHVDGGYSDEKGTDAPPLRD